MIGNDVITGVIAVIAGYLLGSIPSAYVITRLVKSKDIRKIGGGNVGARNVFVEVGKAAGIGVGIFDVLKGAGAVALATWLLKVESPEVWSTDISWLFVLGAGLAVVAGHIWSVYLKFTGGNGLATTLGVLVMLMPQELALALAATLVLVVLTRNIVLSVNLSLLSVPISAWFLGKSWLSIVFPIVLVVVMLLHFFPRIVADFTRTGGLGNFVAELTRRDKATKRGT
jgi:glycerol-3-phosphate acyltransferase PlsY